MNKFISLVMSVALFHSLAFAELKSAWSGCDNCAQPESVYLDPVTKKLFISNVAGTPDGKDGQGWISQAATNGKVIKAKWVEGLNAPKGMRSYKDSLWVADITSVVEISIKDAKILNTFPVPGAVFLNDVAILAPSSPKGQPRVLVSDTIGGKIFEISEGKVSTFAEGPHLEAPNGLLVDGKSLIIAGWGLPEKDWSTKVPGRLLRMDLESKAVLPITLVSLGNLDGLEKDGKGNYIVSDWMAGKVFRVGKDGKSVLLVEGLKGAADLAYVANTKQIIVPCMNENMIRAYRAP